jgi:redox-sensitive bicupin YhaK (pirin superfamily)
MIRIRPSDERGHVRYDWLDTYHSFSFGEYFDPRHMGYSILRVINEDTIAPGGGFPTHGHRDMEIVTYVLSGALQHRDSMGNGSVIRPGEVQHMSAGRGVRHSEFNASDSEPVHLLQIWLLPGENGIEPTYQQQRFPVEERSGQLRLLVSPDGRGGSIAARQEGFLFGALLDAGTGVEHRLEPGRRAYLQLARGAVEANGQRLRAGDGAFIEQETGIAITGVENAELLLFDLP